MHTHKKMKDRCKDKVCDFNPFTLRNKLHINILLFIINIKVNKQTNKTTEPTEPKQLYDTRKDIVETRQK